MKTRITTAFIAGIFALVGCIILNASSLAQTATPNATGNWTVHSAGARFNSGTITLHQEGQTIVGHYASNGSISGKMGTPMRLDATWTDSRGTGWMTCHFNAEFTTFDGEWGYQGKPVAGRFVGRRAPGTPTPYQSP